MHDYVTKNYVISSKYFYNYSILLQSEENGNKNNNIKDVSLTSRRIIFCHLSDASPVGFLLQDLTCLFQGVGWPVGELHIWLVLNNPNSGTGEETQRAIAEGQ